MQSFSKLKKNCLISAISLNLKKKEIQYFSDLKSIKSNLLLKIILNKYTNKNEGLNKTKQFIKNKYKKIRPN